MGVSKNIGFYPQIHGILNFNRVFHDFQPSILGYPCYEHLEPPSPNFLQLKAPYLKKTMPLNGWDSNEAWLGAVE